MYISKVSFSSDCRCEGAAAAYFATSSIAPIVSYDNTRASKLAAYHLRQNLTWIFLQGLRQLAEPSSASSQDGLHRFQWTVSRLSEGDSSGNDDRDFGTRSSRAGHREFAADAAHSFAHSLQTEMSFLPLTQHSGVNTDAIVTYA